MTTDIIDTVTRDTLAKKLLLRDQLAIRRTQFSEVDADLRRQVTEVRGRLEADNYDSHWARSADEERAVELQDAIDVLAAGPLQVDGLYDTPGSLSEALTRQGITDAYGMQPRGAASGPSWRRTIKWLAEVDAEIAALRERLEPGKLAGRFRLKPGKSIGRARGGDVVELTVSQARAFADVVEPINDQDN